ncbi:hypothetical protein Ato02nite_018080 [Paractinoplanes toevensis]|uniref:Uncharacterized protein n=1 Tax=Paractinoplanes toevensis TaxID=571911 RepID=A0A919T6N6_9ACTN|nr:hypothetical protein Ato02nite_018080 [Actinoplanes toevensis]
MVCRGGGRGRGSLDNAPGKKDPNMRKPLLTAIAIGAVATGLCGALATAAIAATGNETEPVAAAAPVQAQQRVSHNAVTQAKAGTSANKELLRLEAKIKTDGVWTSVQVAEMNRLVKQLKADGKATQEQLTWLALTPAEKLENAAPVGRN